MKVNCRYREHSDGKVSLDQDDVVAILRKYGETHSIEVLLELAEAFASVRRLVPLTEMLKESNDNV